MFRQNIQGMKVPKKFPGYKAGDTFTGVSYGDDLPCPKCLQRHTVYETQQAYDVARALVDCLPAIGGAMMLGVLRSSDDKWFAACSAHDRTAGHNALIKSSVAQKKYLPSQLRIIEALARKKASTRNGENLSKANIQSCTVTGNPIAGRCAAPKLLNFAISNNLPRPWTMSEVFYDPARDNANYSDYITAESCQSCQQLLPLMLCKHPSVSFDLMQFTGMMRAIGWQ